MTNLTELLGGRKFALSVIAQLLTGALVWFQKIDPGAYTTVTLAIVGAYIAGNVIQKAQDAK